MPLNHKTGWNSQFRGCTTQTGYFKCREVKTGFYRNKSMQTGSSGTLIGWKSGQTTFVPLWDRMEGAWLWTQRSDRSDRWYVAGKNIRCSYQNVLFCARTFCTVHKQNVVFLHFLDKKIIYLFFKVPKLYFISSKPIHFRVIFKGLSHDTKIF